MQRKGRKRAHTLIILVSFLTIIAIPSLIFGQADDTLKFEQGQQKMSLTEGTTVQVNNGDVSTISILVNREEKFNQTIDLGKITQLDKILVGNNSYLVIQYRLDGTSQALSFEVLDQNYESIYQSDLYEGATPSIEGNEITIESIHYEKSGIRTEPDFLVTDHFKILDGSVQKVKSEKEGTESANNSGFTLSSEVTVDEKYENPTYAEINRILTEEALKANLPPEIVKAIAFQESGWQQYWLEGDTPVDHYTKKQAEGNCQLWDGTNFKLGYDCIGIGIMQVSDYRYINNETERVAEIERLKTDIRYNIQEGIKILKEKWEYSRGDNPLIPQINDNDPMKLENWYFAILAYNGLLDRNNPLKNPTSAYQERIYQHLSKYGLLEEIRPFPTHKLSPYLNDKGILKFKNNHINIPPSPQVSVHNFTVGDTVYVTAPSLYFRDNPAGNAIGSLSRGTKLTITGSFTVPSNSSNGQHYVWYPAKTTDGQEGFVAGSYLSPNPDPLTYSLDGPRRYETSVAISNFGWHHENASAVVLGRGDLPIDSLTGSVLASKLDVPLLLTTSDTLQDITVKEINRLKPKTIYLLGGTAAISEDVEKELAKKYAVVRIKGSTRYETAYEVANKVNNSTEIFVTTGDEESPDPLAIAPYAGFIEAPILLTRKDSLSEPVARYIQEKGVTKVTIVGGTSAVSEKVEEELWELVLKNGGFAEVERVKGSDRYETSLAIATKYFDQDPEKPESYKIPKIFFSRGDVAVDALSASSLAARNNAPIILTTKNSVPENVNQWLHNLTIQPKIFYLGDQEAINPETRQTIENIYK